jgi:gamma-glutamylcyclotransferase (GGCT)/AIG2-like uncharacterized protein YtfP
VSAGSPTSDVFAYGTLRDPEYQQALFDCLLPTRPATLAGWIVVVAESGYFTVVAGPGESVHGDLVTLDAGQLALADAWEDTLYERRLVVACDAAGSPVPAFLYVRRSASRERPAPGTLARHERSEVLAAIRAFRLSFAGTAKARSAGPHR